MESSTGKITFTYIAKVIIWTIVIGLLASIILAVVSASGIGNANDISLEEGMGFLKTLLIGLLVVEVLTIFLSCRLATSKIKKKYEITEENRHNVIKNITIFLVIWAVLIVFLNLGIKSLIDIAFEEANEEVENAEEITSLINEDDEEVEKALEILDFVNTMTVVLVVANAAVVLLMIPLERKWLSVEKEEKKE